MGDSDRIDDRILSAEEWREREMREAMERIERKVKGALRMFMGLPRRPTTDEERAELLDLFPEIN
jgi:hypothetical protein